MICFASSTYSKSYMYLDTKDVLTFIFVHILGLQSNNSSCSFLPSWSWTSYVDITFWIVLECPFFGALYLTLFNMSHIMRKPVHAIAICEQQRCCLASIIPLVSISKISSLYLASVAAQASLSLKPRRQVFSWQGAYLVAEYSTRLRLS